VSIIVKQDTTIYSLLLYFCKLLYMFRVVTPGAHITVITVICAPDDGWSYHPKHVEQFTEI